MSHLMRDRRMWLGLSISAGAIWLALRSVDLRSVAAALGDAHYRWLVPTVVVIVLGQMARAVRWRVLFGDAPRPSVRMSFLIISVGYFVSTVLPLRLGDPVRAWLVETRTPGDAAEALATVIVERALDLVTIVALLAIWLSEPAAALLTDRLGDGWWTRPAPLRAAAAGIVLLGYAGVIAPAIAARPAARIAGTGSRWLLSVLPEELRLRASVTDLPVRLERAVLRFARAFGPLSRPQTAMLAVGWSFVVWWLGALGYWLVMPVLSLDLSFATALFVMGTVAVFAIVPSSPGYVGVFHAAVVAALAIMAEPVTQARALSYAIVLHGVTFMTLIVLGLVGMAGLGLRWEGLTTRASRMDRRVDS